MMVAMSTTYDTDMLDPLAIGNCTLNAAVSEDRATKNSSGRTGVRVARGTSAANVTAPSTMTATMYLRARGGRARSKTNVSIQGAGPGPAVLTPVKQVFYTVV